MFQRLFAVLAALLSTVGIARAETTLVIESWRTDDLAAWRETIIPAFEAAHPGIKLRYAPTAPTEYNAAVNAKLKAGTAGDVVALRPFDASAALFAQGRLVALDDAAVRPNFPDAALKAWMSPEGTLYGVPVASVMHGFLYNKGIFAELHLAPPTSEAEFFALLDVLKADGRFIPLALGAAEQWEAATVGFQNIGPNFWRGEEGRKALMEGRAKFSDPPTLAAFDFLARLKPYLAKGFEAQTNADTQNLFALGKAAIVATGSWDVEHYRKRAKFAFDAFPPPVKNPGDVGYVCDHVDLGFGVNAKTKHPQAAQTFLAWLASPEFAAVYARALPGFYPLAKHPVVIDVPAAATMLAWRTSHQTTIRSTYETLPRIAQTIETLLWEASAGVLTGRLAPTAAAKKLDEALKR